MVAILRPPAADLVVQSELTAETDAREAADARTDNPHATTKAQVGLADVDNTSDDDKPVSTAQAAADDALDTRLDVLEVDTGWTALALEPDVSIGGTWAHRGARKIGKEVTLTFNLGIASPAAEKLLFVLGQPFKPANLGGLRINLNPGAGTNVRIAESGEVRANAGSATSIGTVKFLID